MTWLHRVRLALGLHLAQDDFNFSPPCARCSRPLSAGRAQQARGLNTAYNSALAFPFDSWAADMINSKLSCDFCIACLPILSGIAVNLEQSWCFTAGAHRESTLTRGPHAFPPVGFVEKGIWLKRVCESMDKLLSLPGSQGPHFRNGYQNCLLY